jgi:hypothetical protein
MDLRARKQRREGVARDVRQKRLSDGTPDSRERHGAGHGTFPARGPNVPRSNGFIATGRGPEVSQEDEKPETGGPSANRVLRPYRAQVAGVLAAAFTLSLAYSVVVTFTGSHEGYGLTDPALWVFYAVGYGLAALTLTDRTWAWWATAAGVLSLIAVGIFYYPTVFPPAAQTAFAWFENDVYVGLLILAEYLCVQRLRGVSLVP